jgi:hypothetical protein
VNHRGAGVTRRGLGSGDAEAVRRLSEHVELHDAD